MAKFYQSPFLISCECGYNAYFHPLHDKKPDYYIVSCTNNKCEKYGKKYKIKKQMIAAEEIIINS